MQCPPADERPRRLHLHVGHGKTGSSYVQSWLAINAGALRRDCGLCVPLTSPVTRRSERNAARSRFSSGNGFIFEDIFDSRRSRPASRSFDELAGPGRSLVFSSERFMRSLPPRLEQVEAAALAGGFSGVSYLLFIRDPLPHADSLYAQMVKAHGYSSGREAWYAEYTLLDHVETFLSGFNACRHSELSVVNYSRAADRILEHLGAWLGVDPASPRFRLPDFDRVNRSLTDSELQVQLLANRLLGPRAALIGNRLVDELPAVPPAVPSGPLPARRAFLERVRPQVERLNRRLPEAQHYSLDLPPPRAGAARDEFSFSGDQLETIVSELCRAASSRVFPARAAVVLRRARSLPAWLLDRVCSLFSRR